MTRTPFILALCLVAVGCAGTTTSATDPDYAPAPAEPASDTDPATSTDIKRLQSPTITYKDATGFFQTSYYKEYPELPVSRYPAIGPLPDPVNIMVRGTVVMLRVDAVPVPTDGSLNLEAGLLTLCPMPSKGGVLLGRRHMSDDSWAERSYEVARPQEDGPSVLYNGICRLQRSEERPDLALRITGEWPVIANDIMRRRIDLLAESLEIIVE